MSSTSSHVHNDETPCFCPPHPGLSARIQAQRSQAQTQGENLVGKAQQLLRIPTDVAGLNDGLLFPPESDAEPSKTSTNEALERALLRGAVKCLIVLVDFADQKMGSGVAAHFRDLFFSTKKLPNGSVAEYYTDVSSGNISLTGEVRGPYRMPKKKTYYANGKYGTSNASPNVQNLAADALAACKSAVNFDPYDNDKNGQVDAFIVVHAGQGAEASGNVNDIWSVKWVLPTSTKVNNVNVYAFLTIPEDAQIGVCSHEVGHLLFGWPDLYDIDGSSQGIGKWCLMASGSWGGSPPGSKPVHPSAWCKLNQGWVSQQTVVSNGSLTLEDVKTSKMVYRLWTNGDKTSKEYFLVENREQVGFDQSMPGQGLLVWHIDDATTTNSDESHYIVGLMQADGLNQMGKGSGNCGDAGDVFPGSTRNATFNSTSNPNSKSYAGGDTFVSITKIPAPAAKMTVSVTVKPASK